MAVVGSQFSSGDQSSSVREFFWASYFRKCPNQCGDDGGKDSTIQSEDHIAGCRMNGDGYGTTVFKCTKCGWNTSFQYDEASEPYYYETRFWTRPKPGEPLPPPHPWAGVSLRSWLSSHPKIDKGIFDKCVSSGLLSHAPTFADMTFRHFKALGFTKEEAQLLAKVIEEKNQELEAL